MSAAFQLFPLLAYIYIEFFVNEGGDLIASFNGVAEKKQDFEKYVVFK